MSDQHPSHLIVNADDFGYFQSVSRGIITAHKQGIVTATGVLSNLEGFTRDIELLRAAPSLDIGVHLNLTHGQPVSKRMRDLLGRFGGLFPGKMNFARAYLTGRISPGDVEEEWRAQIEKCVNQKLELRFLNSHEHLHMFPKLFTTTKKLADEYGIRFVRFSRSNIRETNNFGSFTRGVIINIFEAANTGSRTVGNPAFIGLAESGKLSEGYIIKLLRKLKPGQVYELMCHPGYSCEPMDTFPDLKSYHHWEEELRVLTCSRIITACSDLNVRLVSYRELAAMPKTVTPPEKTG